MTNNKITKRDYFEAIMSVANDNGPEDVWGEGILSVDVAEFCKKEIEKLDKRATSPAKPTKAQILAEKDSDVIAAILAEAGKPCTVEEIITMVADRLEGKTSCQRITSLLSKACNNGKAKRTTDKKTSYYEAVTADAE